MKNDTTMWGETNVGIPTWASIMDDLPWIWSHVELEWGHYNQVRPSYVVDVRMNTWYNRLYHNIVAMVHI